MTLRRRKAFKSTALFLVFSLIQLYVQISFGAPGEPSAFPSPQRQIVGRLITRGNQPITVNGASVTTGGVITTSTTIETPDGVGATVDLGPLGTLDLAPNTVVQLDFSEGRVKVTLKRGCALLRTKKGTEGSIETSQGVADQTDKNRRKPLGVCFPPGAAAPTVSVQAATSAGVGAGVGAGAAAAGGGGLFGMGTAATVAIVAGVGSAIAIPIIVHNNRGNNPSGSTP